VASALAAEALTEAPVDGGGERRIAELIQEANRRARPRLDRCRHSGMGTIMVARETTRIAFGRRRLRTGCAATSSRR
jgi:hypothetical protein